MSQTVIRIVGRDFSKEKEREINIWYSEQLAPLILTGQAVACERYQLIEKEETPYAKGVKTKAKAYPKYLAIYEFQTEKALNDYLASPLRDEARRSVPKGWREEGHFKDVWAVNYKRIIKQGANDLSCAFTVVAISPRGINEDELNYWYNTNHMVHNLRRPQTIRAERYQRIGDDDNYPKYLCVYRYANEQTMEESSKHFLAELGVPDRRKLFPDDVWDRRWHTSYRLISKERKDWIE